MTTYTQTRRKSCEHARVSGYINKSMSVRAQIAYDEGERPKSKWTKKDFQDHTAHSLKGVSVGTLRDKMLMHSSWHHTSMLYNETDFYILDIYKLEHLTVGDIEAMKTPPKPRKKPCALKSVANQCFKYQNKYKTVKGLYKALLDERVNDDELLDARKQAIDTKREELRKIWSVQLPEEHYNNVNIENDEYIGGYIK